MDRDKPDNSLVRLAASYGVETTYDDWRGRRTPVTTETLITVLAALGVDASTPSAVAASLAERRRTRLLPPVTVCGAGSTGSPARLVTADRLVPDNVIDITLPSGWEGMTPGASDGVAAGSGLPLDARAVEGAALGVEVRLRVADGEVVRLDRAVLHVVTDGETRAFLRFRVPDGVPVGWHEIEATAADGRSERAALLVTRVPALPSRRSWGLMTQLYSMRSRGSWGMGDLRDLAELTRWSGRLGAGFALVNPLHATEPGPPISPSPYLPMSRRFASPLYLRVEDIPEMTALDPAERAEVTRLGAEMSARNLTLEELDRDAVWAAKGRALEALHRVPLTEGRRRQYDTYRLREGDALTSFATWCALAELHGADWRRWPAGLHDPGSPQVAAERARLAERVDFHAWLQWQLDQQLDTAQAVATASGMSIGIVHDLAVGVHPGGADAWTYQALLAPGMSVGAPPDAFNQRGQDWGQPAWHPGRLAEAAYAPFRELLGSTLRHAGGLRLDHAMQVSRLWWVPEGGSPADGVYVRYGRDLLSVLNHEADQAGAVVIGEDLGTVEPGFRDDLADHHILGTSLLWFERSPQPRSPAHPTNEAGTSRARDAGASQPHDPGPSRAYEPDQEAGDEVWLPKPPSQWRALSLATVGSHDLPPITGFLHGDHVALRERLGLLERPAKEEYADHTRQLGEWLELLRSEGLLKQADPSDDDVVTALHAFLASTPALLVGISLADAVGERRTQNQPGTTDEYPNWRVPLADAEGNPVLLEDLPTNERVTRLLGPVLHLR
jgi:4-alpha-glucanotransferase